MPGGEERETGKCWRVAKRLHQRVKEDGVQADQVAIARPLTCNPAYRTPLLGDKATLAAGHF